MLNKTYYGKGIIKSTGWGFCIGRKLQLKYTKFITDLWNLIDTILIQDLKEDNCLINIGRLPT